MISNVCPKCGLTACACPGGITFIQRGTKNYDEGIVYEATNQKNIKKAILCAEIKGLWKALGEKLDEWEKFSS